MSRILGWGELPEQPERLGDFQFDADFLCQYEAVHSWIRLYTTTTAAKDCEFYFRRFPFHGLPVTRESHLRYVCEMWFSRVYEYKERLKVCLNSLNAALASPKIDAGSMIKSFAKDFDMEIRERNKVHHHQQFEDIMLEKIGLTHMMSLPIGNPERDRIRVGWRMEHDAAYREMQREWAARVKMRGQRLDIYTGVIGNFMVEHMNWLTEPYEMQSQL